MIRSLLLALMLAGVSACGPKAAAQKETLPPAVAETPATDAISELARVYEFSATVTGEEASSVETARPHCFIRLDADDSDPRADVDARRVWIEPACYDAFPVLRAVRTWEMIPTAGVRLLGGDPPTMIGEFSPVQDGTGVYIRGGAGADGKVYEMRTTEI